MLLITRLLLIFFTRSVFGFKRRQANEEWIHVSANPGTSRGNNCLRSRSLSNQHLAARSALGTPDASAWLHCRKERHPARRSPLLPGGKQDQLNGGVGLPRSDARHARRRRMPAFAARQRSAILPA